mgnify:CR=1 FL=1
MSSVSSNVSNGTEAEKERHSPSSSSGVFPVKTEGLSADAASIRQKISAAITLLEEVPPTLAPQLIVLLARGSSLVDSLHACSYVGVQSEKTGDMAKTAAFLNQQVKEGKAFKDPTRPLSVALWMLVSPHFSLRVVSNSK